MPEKLDIGRVAQGIADIYGKHAGALLPPALLVFVLLTLPSAVLRATDSVAVGLVSLVAALFGLVGTIWYTGMVVQAVNEVNQGREKLSIGELFTAVGPRVAPLFGIGILAVLGIAFGLILLIVPGLILLTWWAVIAPAIVIEKEGMGAFGRSHELVKGNGWRVFGILVLIVLLTNFVSTILRGIGSSISDFWGFWVGNIIASTLIAPIGALAAAIMFFELKRIHGESTSAAGPPDPTATAPATTPADEPPEPPYGESVPPPSS